MANHFAPKLAPIRRRCDFRHSLLELSERRCGVAAVESADGDHRTSGGELQTSLPLCSHGGRGQPVSVSCSAAVSSASVVPVPWPPWPPWGPIGSVPSPAGPVVGSEPVCEPTLSSAHRLRSPTVPPTRSPQPPRRRPSGIGARRRRSPSRRGHPSASTIHRNAGRPSRVRSSSTNAHAAVTASAATTRPSWVMRKCGSQDVVLLPLVVHGVCNSLRGARGNLVRIRDCPAAVSGNDSRQKHWTRQGSGKRWPVGRHTVPVPASPKTCHRRAHTRARCPGPRGKADADDEQRQRSVLRFVARPAARERRPRLARRE
ncbi:hypothetical protein JD82_02153 [Prauserella rugosa]|uniref:Uncharacterized protein n=1 Tax=Prauserella rugosa TaxID=43354 RepID=A0A660C9M2_9PSEU|nr:hypothetical protein JD82_02153 [Prauserella rugosa]